MNADSRKRLLLVAESITLAQVVRLAALGRALDPARYEVHFASGRFPELVFAGTGFIRHPIETLPADQVLRLIQRGVRPYGRRVLGRYAEAEGRLIDKIRPDLVVGDFRLSLAASAPAAGVPLAVLINAYWSPYRAEPRWPVPDHPVVDLLGEKWTGLGFEWARPLAFRHFAAPVNDLRRRHGLAPVGSLAGALVHGDWTLYPDDPAMFPLADAPGHHRFLGPVPWAPELPLAEEFAEPDPQRPLVYVTLGSSGRLDWMELVSAALGSLPVRVLLASAGRPLPGRLPDNFTVCDFVPGDRAARAARLVICNGGSTTGYQALAEGTPVLGLPSNLDQYLAMDAIEASGAGRLVKARTATPESLREAVAEMLEDDQPRRQAGEIARRWQGMDAAMAFRAWIDQALGQAC